ncbi:hypothetical protein T459_11851 [Capsicum annuum]|uniref:Pentatricopeptide repeat-containing protein n=2 Tax=Capsicum annuum TaxID=4072 RepID=A0A2G2ZN44_CAPAN|nr:hypothetical protein T459_11851 [Capsicum annuum]
MNMFLDSAFATVRVYCCKGGKPPTTKLSDRRAYKRQKHTTMNAAADFLVGSDDGREKLLAAASAVANTAQALSSSFWKQMEQLFHFISEIDTTVLRQQLGDLKFGSWIESFIHETGIQLDDYLTISLIDLYAKCGSIDKAYKLFRGLKKKDLAGYTAMIL